MDSASPDTAGTGRASNGDAAVAVTAPLTGFCKRDWGRTPCPTGFGGTVTTLDDPLGYRRAGHPPATGDGHP